MSAWPLTLRGTGALVLAVVCGVLAQRFGIVELAYVGALLVVVVALSAATLYLLPQSARVTRSFSPDVTAVGARVHVRLTVQTRSSLPLSQGRWRDRLPDGVDSGPDTDRDGPGGLFPATASAMGGESSVELTYLARAARRGIRSVGPLSVVTTDPFGVVRRRRSVGGSSPLVIVPELVDLSPLSDLPGDAGGSTRSVADRLGQGADNLIPRTYAPGDSMRRIHWRASAHRDELMVRQEEQETTPEAIVVLDRSAHRWPITAARAAGADPGFEAAVSACLSATALLVREGYLVTVIDADGAVLCDPIEGGDIAGIEQLAIALATVTTRRDAPLDALVRLFAGVSAGPLVVVTGAIDDADVTVLAPLPPHSSLPILLAVSADPVARAHATDTGWHTAVVVAPDDLAAAWADATAQADGRGGGARVVV